MTTVIDPDCIQGEFIGADEATDLPAAQLTDAKALLAISDSEYTQRMAHAQRYPRSLKDFMDEVQALVSLNVAVAESCLYAVPRDGKTITGPSARFAEILAHCWGNNLAGGRVVAEDAECVTAQGAFHDLQKNASVMLETRRRITDKNGFRYSPDMVMTTGNAAVSVAHRNAILKGIPKALWWGLYEEARLCAIGTVETLADRRGRAIAFFGGHGIPAAKVYAKLGVHGREDIGLPQLEILLGLASVIRENPDQAERLFAPPVPEDNRPPASIKNMAGVAAAVAGKRAAKPANKARAKKAAKAAAQETPA